MAKANTPASARREHGPLADQDLFVSLESRLKLDQLRADYIGGLPAGGTKEFRARVDTIVDRLGEIDKFGEPLIHKVFCQVNGELSQLSAKATASMSEEQRRETQENFLYRNHALKFAADGMRLFSVPTRENPLPENFQFNAELDGRAQLAARAPDPEKGMLEFVQFLSSKLADKSQRWNSVNIVTALYKLCDLDQNWPSRVFGQAIGEQFINKLAVIADKQIFDGQSVCNLAARAPSLIEVVGRMNPHNPILEKRLFGALGKAVEYTNQKPGEQYADKAFLLPLREITSRNLSKEGGAALCGYVAKLNNLFSHMAYARNLRTIADTFHALNGISSWALHPDSDAKLTIMLRNLNDRLQKSLQTIDAVSAGSIIYGLKGLEVGALSQEAVEQVARTMRLVADRLNRLPLHTTINYQSLSAMIKGLSTSLQLNEGPAYRASQDLLIAIQERLPRHIANFDDLGCACGALVTLRPHIAHHTNFTKKLMREVILGSATRLPFTRYERADYIAWQVTQQAFALYREPMPHSLQNIIQTMAPTVIGSANPSRSELRVAEWARAHPGVTIEKTRFQDGFELDILINKNINIEVDGAFHREPAKVIADQVRDEHLSLKPNPGLRIIRVPSTITRQAFDQILSEALREKA
jgi:hypothetical protein